MANSGGSGKVSKRAYDDARSAHEKAQIAYDETRIALEVARRAHNKAWRVCNETRIVRDHSWGLGSEG
jgi:hypothetical protein